MSTIKRYISLLIVFCLLLGQLSPMTHAMGDELVGDRVITESTSEQTVGGSCGESLTWTLDDSGELTISGTGEMTNFTGDMPAHWNNYRNSIWCVVVGDGVTSVGDKAFSGCCNLMDAQLGKNVSTIGSEAFLDCTSLYSLQLNNQLQTIQSRAFKNSGLWDVWLGNELTSIGEEAFADCKNLNSVELGGGLTSVGAYAFSGCTELKKIVFPANVEEIGSFACGSCTNLRRIQFLGEAPAFGEEVFRNVTAVVFYPGNDASWIPHISQGYGGNITWAVYLDCGTVGHTYEPVVTEPTCTAEGYTTYTCFYCGDIYIDDYVQPLGHNFVDGVCTNCSLVLEIVAEGPFGLGNQLNWRLNNLGELTIYGSGNMNTYSSAEKVPWYDYRSSIKSVIVEEGVFDIEQYAFYQYNNLERVTIADTVGYIGNRAFYSCRRLQEINFLGSPPTIKWDSFYNVVATAHYPSDGGWMDELLEDYGGSITWIEKQICDPAEHINETVVTVPSCAEMGYTTHICTICGRSYVEAYTNALGHSFADGECTVCGITETVVAEGACGANLVWKLTDDGLLDISGTGEMTFESGVPWADYTGIIKCVVIHEGVISIAAKAFNDCALLDNVAIPNSVMALYASFKKCSNLSVVLIPDSVTTLSTSFQDCINLQYVELPAGLTRIGSWVFAGCKKLESIDIPDTVTIIQNNAFHGCSSLQAIRIPEGVHTIEEQAFFNCHQVKEITIPNTVTTIGDVAFAWNSNVAEIVIPASVTNIGERAFMGCAELRKVVIAGDEVTLAEEIFEECTALEEIWFEGRPPVFLSNNVFGTCDATVYYHGGDCIWNEIRKLDFGEATLTWVSLDDEVAEHMVQTHERKEPTCTESGYEAYDTCTVCEQVITEYVELLALGHDYVATVTEPTCTEQGFITYTCAACGDSYVDDRTEAHGHNYESVVTDPTCAKGGYTTYTCTICAYSYVADKTKALGHDYESVVTDPTCTEGGYTTYTCTVCGYSYVGRETKARHSYESVVTDPTCTEGGYTTYTCTVCGYSYVDSETAALGHNYESVVNEGGELTYTCKTCGDSYTEVMLADFRYTVYRDHVEITEYIGIDTELVIPDEIEGLPVTSIGRSAFQGCVSLTSIEIPDGVISIGESAFSSCRKLTNINIPNSVTFIGAFAFSGCASLTSVAIPVGVTSVAGYSFRYCYSLTDIDIPNSVTSIGREAFAYCSNLTSIEIPDSVISIGESAFKDCTSLTGINVDANNQNYSSDDRGVLFDKAKTQLIQAPRMIAGSYVIPNSVTSIYESAFSGCTSLTSVSVPDGVTSIGDYVFNRCTSLTSVDLPDCVTVIGKQSFAFCSSLTSIDIPNSVTSIVDNAFAYCRSLTSISIPDGVTKIGDHTFYDCDSLTSIAIPNSVTSIGDSAFSGCNSLTSIAIPNSVTSIGDSTFSGCTSLTSIDIPIGVTFIGRSAFSQCDSLTNISIPDGITEIGEYSFNSCDSLSNIDLPGSVTVIGERAFSYCKNLTSIVLSNRLTSIGERAFFDCTSLSKIDIPGGVTSIGDYAFSGCTSLIIIYFNGNAPVFGENIFKNALKDVTTTAYYPAWNPTWTEEVMQDYGDTVIWEPFEKPFDYVVYEDHVEITNYNGNDTKVVIPSEMEGLPVTAVGSNAFAQCGNLTSIEIADSVTFIGDCAFCECSSLIDIYFNGDAPAFDWGAFLGVDATVYYPAGNTTWTENVMQDYEGNITWVAYTPCPHEYTAVDTAPTCTDSGYTTYTCSVCGNSYVVYGAKPLGHAYESDVSEEVTATENGEMIYTCTTCGDSYTKIIPAYLRYEIHEDHVEITGYVGNPAEIVIPAEIEGLPVTIIGDSAFYRCYTLTSISIPDGIAVIGDYAFQDCQWITSISIPDSVTSIGCGAFKECVRLNDISIPMGITAIADHTFDYCWDLRSISIPNSITSIDDYAFYGSGLYSVSIPSSVTFIGKDAFSFCPSLTSIDFEDGVATIGNGALGKCEELTSVSFKGDAPEFAQDTFMEITATAYYPADNSTWTADVLQDYGGTISWVSYEVEKPPFADVDPATFYYEPVMWAIENGITNGTSATTFSPNDQCMRAHVVTFLWRAVGCPEPTRTDNPFVDVKSTDFYYKPVLWALENGITSGMDATHFGPTAYCNRAQVVTFLYRTMGSPEVESMTNPFTDVAEGSFYEKAVIWAVENGITNGLSATAFGPNTICNRAQIVTFLYRAFVND